MGVLPPNYMARNDFAQYEAYARAARHAETQAADQQPRPAPVTVKPTRQKLPSARARLQAARQETIEKERRADNRFDLAVVGSVSVLAILYALGWLT